MLGSHCMEKVWRNRTSQSCQWQYKLFILREGNLALLKQTNKKKNLSYTHLVPAVQLPGIYLLDIRAKVHKDTCTRMFIRFSR